jgi:hypothetical protein
MIGMISSRVDAERAQTRESAGIESSAANTAANLGNEAEHGGMGDGRLGGSRKGDQSADG